MYDEIGKLPIEEYEEKIVYIEEYARLLSYMLEHHGCLRGADALRSASREATKAIFAWREIDPRSEADAV